MLMQSWLSQLQESLTQLTDKLLAWINNLILGLPNLVLALLVMALGYFLGKVFRKWVGRLVKRVSPQETVNRLLVNLLTVVFALLVLFVVLTILNLDTALTSLLAGAGVAGLAIGLALQDPIVNLFSGVMMSTKSTFNIDDLVETNGFMGRIVSISLRSTVLRTFQGQLVVIPNKMVYQNPLTNYTAPGERRIDLPCGISYGENLQEVKEVAVKAIEDNVIVDQSRPVDLMYVGFGDSSINFILRFWIDSTRQPDFLTAQSEAIMALKQAFDDNDIVIPFPIRTLDFGIKGGQTITEAWPGNGANVQNGN